MAQQLLTGGDGASGQTGLQTRTIINENTTELYNALGYKRTGDNSVLFTNALNALAVSTGSLATNGLRAFPFEIKRQSTFTDIYTEVTSLAGGSLIRCGIYNDSNGYPNELVANSDVSTYNSGVNGVKQGTFSSAIILNPGVYYFAINSSGTPSMRAIPAGGSRLLGITSIMGTGSYATLWSATFTFAAMPSTFPAGASPTGSVLVTLFGLKPSA